MVKQKSKSILVKDLLNFGADTTPNVDYFTREEVKTMVREFKEKCESGELDRVSYFVFVLLFIDAC